MFHRIISPTFIIVRHYVINPQSQIPSPKSFYHVDLYRTESKHDLLGIGLDQIINNQENVIALEWAEKMGEMLPKKRIDVHCEYMEDNERKITIKNF